MSRYGDGRGTFLTNVHTALLPDGTTVTAVHGAYVWENGWVTIYEGDSQNQGRIFSPAAVTELVFGGSEGAKA